MLAKLGYTDPKLTFFATDRGNEVDEWAKVLFLSFLYHYVGSTRPNSISILAWPKYIYAWCCLRAQKSPTVFHPYGFPTNLERSWIEFPKSWSEQKGTGLRFELGKILFDQCSSVSSARVFFYWKTDYIVPWVGWIKEIISYTGIIHVVYFRWEGSKMHQGAQNKVCEVNRSSMDWPNLNTADSVGRVCGLVKDKRGRAYRLPAKIISNVVHEVKQNKENQESAVFLNSRPLRLPFDSDVRHDWEDFSMDSGTDPFAKCQFLLEIRFWWMRMQNSQTEPGVAARLEVNPSKAPMFCLRRLEIVSAYPAQKPSTVALANHFSEKHAWAHRGYWFSLYSSRYLARQRHSIAIHTLRHVKFLPRAELGSHHVTSHAY